MKKMLFALLAFLPVLSLLAQQKEGKVIYERKTQLQIITSDGGGMENNMPQSRIDKFEMSFANGKMIWRRMEDDIQDDNNMSSGGSGMIIRTFGGGTDDATFCDFGAGRKVESVEFFDKKFIITDSIKRGNWKLTDETTTILDHVCRKATSQRIGKRTSMSINNGKMERREVDDTSSIVAWFTTDIPVAAGPEMQGQLPGLILSLETNNGRSVYTAVQVSSKPDLAAIKEPTKGKKVTREEFIQERGKMLDEMQRNRGDNMQIRVN